MNAKWWNRALTDLKAGDRLRHHGFTSVWEVLEVKDAGYLVVHAGSPSVPRGSHKHLMQWHETVNAERV